MFYFYAILILAALAVAIYGMFAGFTNKQLIIPLGVMLAVWFPMLGKAIEGNHFGFALVLCLIGMTTWVVFMVHMLTRHFRERGSAASDLARQVG